MKEEAGRGKKFRVPSNSGAGASAPLMSGRVDEWESKYELQIPNYSGAGALAPWMSGKVEEWRRKKECKFQVPSSQLQMKNVK